MENPDMSRWLPRACAIAFALAILVQLHAADITVDLSREQVGRPPQSFEPMVGTWTVVEDAGEKAIMVDGRPWVASKDNPTKLLVQSARKLYGTSNEELMDNAKQFAYYPVAVLKGVDSFSNGSISVKFKTVGGDADRCSGILFNVKANGDWLALRYNDTEHNVVLWEFHNGIRRPLIRPRDGDLLSAPGDRDKYHELRLDVDGANITGSLDGVKVLTHVLGSAPVPGRNNAPPSPDLFPENNPVLRAPVAGKVGLWSKTDSTSYFKDYVVSPR
jgi:hypothetical protein